MTGVAATANGVMNTLPWGGPTARAATALKVDAADIFVPMIPALAVGLLAVFLLACVLGLRERKRLGMLTLDEALVEPSPRPSWSVAGGTGPAAAATGSPRPRRAAPAPDRADRRGRTTTRTATGTRSSRASTPTAPPCAPSSTGSTPASPSPC